MAQNQIPLKLDLWEKQLALLHSPAQEIFYGGAAGGGKALCLNTPILTTRGWSCIGDLRVGDFVFSSDGKPTKVVALSEIYTNRPTYKIKFNDNQEIVADENHLWLTYDRNEQSKYYRRTEEFRAKRRSNRVRKGKGIRPDVLEKNINKKQAPLPQYGGTIRATPNIVNCSILNAKAIECPTANLPIDPYILGLWLGDGNSDGCGLTTADAEIISNINACGYEARKRRAHYAWGILGIHRHLKAMGLLKNKHIPITYLLASKEQRLALLQGLMDTDGSADKDGGVLFTSCDERLARQVFDLVATLGYRVRLKSRPAKVAGRVVGVAYSVVFTPLEQVFRLPRKAARLHIGGERSKWRKVISVTAIQPTPTRCIQVEAQSGMFLAGRALIPTHNSHVARVAAIVWCCEIPGLQIYFFRRYSDDLKLNHLEGPTGFRGLLSEWCKAGLAEVIESEIRFKNGSKIFLRSCQYERDLPRVLGPEIHVLFLEECGQFLESMIRFIRGRLRIPDELKIPEKYLLPQEYWVKKNKPEYSFPRAIYTSNPGGPGHAYLKKAFVAHGTKLFRASAEDGGALRQFIPAMLQDNPSIDRARYEANLKGLGSPQLVRALLLGDWDAVVGAFFPEIEKYKHLIEPFRIPDYWVRFMAMDWGACGEGDPFIIGWWAVSDGSIPKYPKNTLICYRIWNGSGMPKTTAMAVAQGIKDREFADGQIVYRVAGGDIGQERGTGPSIRELFANHGINFAKADQSRVSGWQQVRERLSGADSIPLIYWFKECENDLETMQNLQHDTNDPNDASQDNDHVAEMVRYACMSRPWSRAAEKKKPKLEELFKTPTIDQMWAERERLMKNLRH